MKRVVIGRFIGHREHTATAPKPSTFPASHTAKLSTWYARKSPNSRPSAHPPMDMPWRLARFLKKPASLFGVCPVLDMCTRTPVLVATFVCRSPQCRACKRVVGRMDRFAWPGQGDRLKAAVSGWVKGRQYQPRYASIPKMPTDGRTHAPAEESISIIGSARLRMVSRGGRRSAEGGRGEGRILGIGGKETPRGQSSKVCAYGTGSAWRTEAGCFCGARRAALRSCRGRRLLLLPRHHNHPKTWAEEQ